jgi:hypothetical protein
MRILCDKKRGFGRRPGLHEAGWNRDTELVAPPRPRILASDRKRGGGAVGDRDHRAALVDVQPAAVGRARAFVPDQRLVRARAVHIAPDELVRGVALADHVGAIIAEPGSRYGNRLTGLPGRGLSILSPEFQPDVGLCRNAYCVPGFGPPLNSWLE